MAIWLNKDSKVIVQGMTGATGMKHTKLMLGDGTEVVGGVNPRKAGTTVDFDGNEVPVFGTVKEAIEKTGANVSVIFVPEKFTKDAVVEAIDAEIPLAVVITEGIAVHDSAAFWSYAGKKGNKTRIIGPNCPGIITPGQSNVGIIPGDITKPGRIGLVSKSGTLTYQMMYELRDIGFSTAVGIGGDPIIGTTHIDALAAFEGRPRDRPDRHDRRDRRRRRGACGRVHLEERDQAGRRLRRGLHRARGQDHGPRRCHRLRFVRHRPGEEGGPGGRRRQGRQDPDRDGEARPRHPGRLTPPRAQAERLCHTEWPALCPQGAGHSASPCAGPRHSSLGLSRSGPSCIWSRSFCRSSSSSSDSDPGATLCGTPRTA
ncbi:succinyl-CoA synthetase alpha subunit [Streptomyces ambofaciens]